MNWIRRIHSLSTSSAPSSSDFHQRVAAFHADELYYDEIAANICQDYRIVANGCALTVTSRSVDDAWRDGGAKLEGDGSKNGDENGARVGNISSRESHGLNSIEIEQFFEDFRKSIS